MSVVPIQTPYWEWVKSEAALVDTDGCSGVTGVRIECCFEHDLGFFHAKDPRSAYRHWRANNYYYWEDADAIDRDEVDARFRQCLQNRSRFGRWSPMAWWRWVGVRWKAQAAWDTHRAREQAARERAETV